MSYYLGIDLGTSSLKAVAIDASGRTVASGSAEYDFEIPRSGWAEQTPSVWYDAAKKAVGEVLKTVDADEIASVGLSGQMHGLVTLDYNKNVVRPAILHCDARSKKQVNEIKQILGDKLVSDTLLNPIYAGFALVSLFWLRENERENYDAVSYALFPKDYLYFKLTGELATDYSDASASLAFDVANCRWANDVLDKLKFFSVRFPRVYNSCESAGSISAAAAKDLGLREGTPVAVGGGDAVMQSLGNGLADLDTAIVNIGSSGQVFFLSDKPIKNPALSTNTFCSYEKGRWYTMGAIMSAGLAFKWICRNLKFDDYAALDREIDKRPIGSGPLFLPYLSGERTPFLNPSLRGAFLGLSIDSDNVAMARAVMEGVSMALYQCFEVAGSLSLFANSLIMSGGGAKSPVWAQMIADVFDRPVRVSEISEQAATGAAMCAAVCAGAFSDMPSAVKAVSKLSEKEYKPIRARHDEYMKLYSEFKNSASAALDYAMERDR